MVVAIAPLPFGSTVSPLTHSARCSKASHSSSVLSTSSERPISQLFVPKSEKIQIRGANTAAETNLADRGISIVNET